MKTINKNSEFNLLRWFALISPIAIVLIGLANGWLISTFLNNHLFQREAAISRDFVQNILVSDGSLEYLSTQNNPVLESRFANSIEHLSNMHDVLRTNVYSANRVVLWSTDRSLIGQQFAANDELDEALEGSLVVHAGSISDEKDEHVGLPSSVHFFVESYIPVLRPGSDQVVGVVELYKAPLALTQAIQEGRRQVALAALAGALALYACLYWLIRRADRIIKQQRSLLMESETMAVVGELTSSVAHNIRNPLSSIRSAAEMVQAFPQDDHRGQAEDIIREVDRISARVTELLRLSGKGVQQIEKVRVSSLLEECTDDHQVAFASRGQKLHLSSVLVEIEVEADRTLLLQALLSLLSNASEAMTSGGECTISLIDVDAHCFRIDIADQGGGFDLQQGEQFFRPFFTTKPKGLGLGLPLAKRIVERFGGHLQLLSVPGMGTTASITLPKARAWPVS